MEALTAQASPSENHVTDEEFDLMLGELESDAPENSPNPATCAINHVYCIL